LRHINSLGSVQASNPFQQRCQIFPLDVFHREKMATLDLADIVDPADARMRNLPRYPHFRKQPLAPNGIICKRLGQEFQRHRLSQFEIVGAVDFSHSAPADQPDNAVSVGYHHAGVNPPTGSESDEIRRPTGAAIAAAAAGDSTAAVGACESELTGAPQEGQNL
jgi:hypothetical protein